MKTRQELTEILDFIADYATYLLASGVHTSRVIRNSQRIGQSQGVDIQLSSFQKSTILTVRDDATGEAVTRVVKIPALPISFELQLGAKRPELGRPATFACPLPRFGAATTRSIARPRHGPDFHTDVSSDWPTPRSAVFSAATGRAAGIVFTATLAGVLPPGSGCRRTAIQPLS